MNILQEAEKIIYGDREATYGDPSKNLTMISNLWEVYLAGKYGLAVDLDPLDVANMMILLKLARLANTPEHHDSMVDIAGYTALQERVVKHAHLEKAQGARTALA